LGSNDAKPMANELRRRVPILSGALEGLGVEPIEANRRRELS
jgi:hypothetical protein